MKMNKGIWNITIPTSIEFDFQDGSNVCITCPKTTRNIAYPLTASMNLFLALAILKLTREESYKLMFAVKNALSRVVKQYYYNYAYDYT